jgi:hypothetical protein
LSRHALPRDWYAFVPVRPVSPTGGRMFWLALAVFLLALNYYAPAGPTLLERSIASAIFVAAFAVVWYWIYRSREIDYGFLPVVLITYCLEYALPIFTLKIYSMEVFTTVSLPDWAVEKSLLLSLIGLVCLVAGYYYPGRRRIAEALPHLRMQWSDRKAVIWMSLFFAVLGLGVFIVTLKLHLSPEIQAYVNRPTDFFNLAIITLLLLQLRNELGWGYAVLLWVVLVPVYTLIGLAQGALGFSLRELTALLIAYTTLRRRIPWSMLALGLLAFLFMQPIKGTLRSMVFAGRTANVEQDQTQKLQALALVSEQGLSIVQTLDPRDIIALATERLAGEMVFATVVTRTPSEIPYWNGASYYPLLFVAIPRLFYRDKPSDLPGNVLGHQYGILQPDDNTTSINLMQLLELYGNFGPIGVIFGSIVIGMIYRTINDIFLREGCGLGALVGGVYLFGHLADIENAASTIFGSLLLEAITVMVFYFAIRFAESVVFAIRQQRELVRPTTMAQVSAIPRGAVD